MQRGRASRAGVHNNASDVREEICKELRTLTGRKSRAIGLNGAVKIETSRQQDR